jgi:hypothetical protein
MRVLLKIRTAQTEIRVVQIRQVLSWGVFFLLGVALMMALVFLITGAFPR